MFILPLQVLSQTINFTISTIRKWGTRLLERNVRAYLQNRGKVNKGIRNTIKVEPELFLAFNNGLTITADNITMRFIDDQQCQIEKLTDFQIVNGGQTCASIWHAKRTR